MHPFFHIGSLILPSYGVFMALGLILACGLAIVRFKRAGGDPNQMFIVAACAVAGGLLGGHLLYLIASYGLDRAWNDIRSGNFSFLQAGGLVFYGSLIGGAIGFFLSSWLLRERLDRLIRVVMPCVPLGHAVGRIGCLFSGCCFGLPYHGWGAVRIEGASGALSVFPIQAVESLLNLLLFAVLLRCGKVGWSGRRMLSLYLTSYSVSRFTLEFFRGDLIRGISYGLSTSQWISLVLFFFGVILLFPPLFQKKQI